MYLFGGGAEIASNFAAWQKCMVLCRKDAEFATLKLVHASSTSLQTNQGIFYFEAARADAGGGAILRKIAPAFSAREVPEKEGLSKDLKSDR